MDAAGIELRHLRALVAVGQEGTFTDAAIRLGVTQSAVSRTIVALERILDAHLVRRTTRSVELTPAGERCYRSALVALAAADDVVRETRGGVRPLRLGYAWSALGRFTSPVLQRWRTEHAGIPLEIHRVDDRGAGLTTGHADVAVVRGEFEEPGVTVRRIFTEPRMAALPVAHPLSGAGSVRLADLRDNVVLLTATGTTRLDLWSPEHRPRSSVRVDNIDEWLTEIAGGLAIGVTVESTAAQHAHPGVVFIPILDAEDVPVHLAWPQHRPHPAVVDFVALVRDVVDAADGVRVRLR